MDDLQGSARVRSRRCLRVLWVCWERMDERSGRILTSCVVLVWYLLSFLTSVKVYGFPVQ